MKMTFFIGKQSMTTNRIKVIQKGERINCVSIAKAVIVACMCGLALHCSAQKKSWGVQMAATIMKTYPDSIVVKAAGETASSRPNRPAQWNYEYGVLLKSFDQLKQQTGNQSYFDYAK